MAIMTYFENLDQSEVTQLEDAFTWIYLLLATTTEKAGSLEQQEALHTVKVRGYEENHLFYQFYDQVHAKMEVNIQSWMDRMGVKHNAAEDYERLLTQLNPILAKLKPPVARRMYKDYLSYADRIANASGGFLGFGRISKAEHDLIGLPMITPIAPVEDEEE